MQLIFANHNKGERPNIHLTIRRVTPNVWYSLGFYKHHYLTHDLNKSCQCFLIEWGSQAVAFIAVIQYQVFGNPWNKNVSRLVVLPDFQGLGLSTKILDFMGGIISAQATKDRKYQLCIKTTHEKMGNALGGNTNWIGTSHDMKTNGTRNKSSRTIVSFCKKYVGKPIYGYDGLLKPIDEMRFDINDKLAHQFTLWQ